jgi:prepilin-type N-terminal cleavage/methylation domain-containing protein
MNKNNAFTLVEIIMVIILIGVLGIIGTIGLNSAVSSDRGMYERQMQSALRYAQNYAMTHFTYTAVVFSPTGSSPSCTITNNVSAYYAGYAVCSCVSDAGGGSLQPLTNPLAQVADNFYVSFNYGITYSVTGLTTNYIAFNSLGEPGTFAGSSCPAIPAANPPANVFNLQSPLNNYYYADSISFGAAPSTLTFYIYPETGLISYNRNL